MQGWICLNDHASGTWLVNIPQCGEKEDIAEISIKEEDLKIIPVMNAAVNEQIKAQFDDSGKKSGNIDTECFCKDCDDISDFML